jgi:hypothetical protein
MPHSSCERDFKKKKFKKISIGWGIFFLLEVPNVWDSNTHNTFGKVVRAEF